MDKKGEVMVKKTGMLFLMLCFVIVASGCHTVYKTSKGAADGAVEGAKQDYERVECLRW